MRTILVEEWVHIPEGGKNSSMSDPFFCSYHDCKNQTSQSEWTQRRDYKRLQTHAS